MALRIIGSVEDFLEREFSVPRESNRTVVFRGHANCTWESQPTLYRSAKLEKNEDVLMSELLTRSPAEFAQDTLAFERLVRARHFGLPTRLLDVTLNPLAALYFACQPTHDNTSGIEVPADGELVRIDVSRSRVKFFDSDTISIISNLSRLRQDERENIRTFFSRYRLRQIPASKVPKDKLWEMPEIKRLVQFIRVEKPYFQNSIVPLHLQQFFLVHPRQSSRRLIAQSGAFIVSGLLTSLRERSSSAFSINRFKIRHRDKMGVLAKLDRLNINVGTMFPEMENASNYLKEKYSK